MSPSAPAPPAGAPATRRSPLHDVHVALGADMAAYSWAGMAMPWAYDRSLLHEQRAVRQAVGLADVSQLQVVEVSGPEAADALEALLPRPIADMQPGESRFTVLLTRFGRIVDEAIVMRLDPHRFWVCHGCGGAGRKLAGLGEHVVIAHPAVAVLSVQGPRSLDLLAPLTDRALAELPFLHHLPATMGGLPVQLSRSGFTGERGYELFCSETDAVELWQLLSRAGASLDLAPYAYRCVDLLRIEAGWALYPAELALAGSLWEAGLGWMVRHKNGAYVGQDAVERSRGSARRRLVGLRCQGSEPVLRGTRVLHDTTEVGSVSSSAWSPMSDEVLCLAWGPRDALPNAVTLDGQPDRQVRLQALPFRPHQHRE